MNKYVIVSLILIAIVLSNKTQNNNRLCSEVIGLDCNWSHVEGCKKQGYFKDITYEKWLEHQQVINSNGKVKTVGGGDK